MDTSAQEIAQHTSQSHSRCCCRRTRAQSIRTATLSDPRQVSTMEILQLADDALRAWVEQGSAIHIKAATKAGDPVELSDEEVRRLIHFLQGYLDTSA